MVVIPRTAQGQPAVAGHYDALDRFYRETWGEHVHHGVWTTGSETPQQATRALVDLVLGRLALPPGGRVADAGCGYGGTARVLADELRADVVGFTLSGAQAAWARERGGGGGRVDIQVRSWLQNGLPGASCDGVVAIESLSHMAPKEAAFAEVARVLRPGARVVLVDWLTREAPGRAETRLLLEPIAREGRLPSLHSVSEYEALLRGAGLEVEPSEDLSARVGRTWAIVARRLGRRVLTDPQARRELLSSANPDRAFAFSLARIPLALRTGALRLVAMSARRPG